MNLLPANERLLAQRFPEVLHRLQAAVEVSLSLQQAADGGLVLEIPATRRPVHPHGRHAPRALARRWAAAQPLQKDGLYAVTGFGTGEHLRALLEVLPENSLLFAQEAEPALLRSVLAQVDLSDLLADKRLLLGTGACDSDNFAALVDAPYHTLGDVQPLTYAPLQATAPAAYEAFFTSFVRAADHWMKLIRANVNDSGLWQEQALRNLPHMASAPDVGQTRGCFEGLPLILVAAGPSLDDSIDFLRAARPHAVVVAVNSAYGKLIAAGIRPHATVAADPRISTWSGYQGCDLEDVPLVAPFMVHPKVAEAFAGRTLTWSANSEIITYWRQKCGLGQGTEIAEMGTVSGCVLDLARLWGCSKVCFVGQDLAFSASGQTHSAGTFYARRGTHFTNLKDCLWLPGNHGADVPLDRKLHIFLQCVQRLIAESPQIEFTNTAANGVRIEGAPYRNHEEALAWLGKGDASAAAECLLAFCRKTSAMATPASPLRPLRRYSARVRTAALQGALRCALFPERHAGPSHSGHREVTSCDEAAGTLNSLLDADPAAYEVLFHGRTKRALSAYARSSREIEGESEHHTRILRNEEYFWALAEGAHFLCRQLEEAGA